MTQRLLQLNLNHCLAAQELLKQTVRELKVDAALLSEPYRRIQSPNYVEDAEGKASIWVCGLEQPQLTDVRSSQFASVMEELALDARGKPQVIIAGDFNAWAEEWGSTRTNAQGQTVLEALATLDMALMNNGNQHTFTRAGTGSVIDLAFASCPIARSATWTISNVYTAIPNWSDNAEVSAELLMRSITDACDASMAVRRSCKRHHAPVYWWNQQIADARRRCIRSRRILQRSRGRVDFETRRLEYALNRRLLKKSILSSKKEKFLELCDEADRDIWGMAYKVVLKKTQAKYMCMEDHVEHRLYTEVPEVTLEEVLLAAARIKESKSPGPDAIPNRALKMAIRLHPQCFTEVFGQCMRQGVFPPPMETAESGADPKAEQATRFAVDRFACSIQQAKYWRGW
ncbi:uncharacterized protein LOC133849886 [Drosophila sulfurigaster albostrigata]|uniref:uncharacterized protein LOC133849886 n=1 Tax=Drosophila sulfurigaster albostrigata TaxID=89887 RepID=UPI002D21B9A8|nr:uncharacterized protein LOC133849886 [Drosophila sulfurigaster albostrigata]